MPSPQDANTEDRQSPEDKDYAAESQDRPEQPDTQAGEAAAGEEAEVPEEAPRPLDVYAVLRISVAQLAGVAWQMMGLQADPFTKTIHKDTAQARVAIDATEALIEKLKPHLQGQEARDYQALLTDLRLNFVRQSEEPEHKA